MMTMEVIKMCLLWVVVILCSSTKADGFISTLIGRTPTNITEHAEDLMAAINRNHHLTNLTTPQMIKANGYPAEVHKVTTEDGYILELHRIPHGRRTTQTTRDYLDPQDPPAPHTQRPIVFLHHCLLCSSSDFIMNEPHKALAYLLADNGYDVWLANARGNTYSRNHVHLSPEDKQFWQFSWHEIGYYDLPAALDYVLQETGEDDLNYIGFSMGTTVYWVLMSERPEYAFKVKFMVAMAPVAYVENMEGPLRYMSWLSTGFLNYWESLGSHEVLSFGPGLDYIVSFFCDEERFTAAICHNSLFLISGSNPDQLNKEFLPAILSHTPAGTSDRTLFHYLQGVRSGKFRKYDYGKKHNLEIYGTKAPPSYDLSRSTAPVALFWSMNDWLASPKDVLHLLSELPNVVYVRGIEDEKFTHLDFIWAIQADELVYRSILALLSNHQNSNSSK